METVERIGRTSRNMPSGKPQRALKSSRRSARIHFVISRSCVRVTSLAPENSGNRMISTVFITFKKSFDPHKLRLHLTPKAFFFDAFQKLPSGNTGLTHTVTHTTKCVERFKEHRRGGFCLLSGIFASFFCLHDLCHETAHFLRSLLLHLPSGVGVGAECEPGIIVAEHRGYCFDVHAILQCQR